MKLCFDSVEELRAFVKDELKGGRGRGKGKDDGDDTDTGGATVGSTGSAPQPLQPPAGGAPGAGPFGTTTQTAGAGPFGGGAPTGGPVADPAVVALVQRINAKTNDAIKSGQPADKVLEWFRGECGKVDPQASAATLEQIQAVYLAKLPVPALEGIAKLMAA